MKRLAILGSTGSIGQNALAVVAEHPQEFQVVGLAAGKNLEVLVEQIKACRPLRVSVQDEAVARELKADGFSYGTAAHALSRLVKKGLARRLRQGVYEVNWKPILETMSSVVEKRENRSEEYG